MPPSVTLRTPHHLCSVPATGAAPESNQNNTSDKPEMRHSPLRNEQGAECRLYLQKCGCIGQRSAEELVQVMEDERDTDK